MAAAVDSSAPMCASQVQDKTKARNERMTEELEFALFRASVKMGSTVPSNAC